jgi:hypothetical protein
MNAPCAYQKQVDRMRRHREELQLALAERLTLDEARERLRSYNDHRPRLEAAAPAPDAPARPVPWWMPD